ncbi:MAG: hypothetical protein KGJ88_00955 [Verrucomicrobiota bacterium]|nr:hypothetical protein [Verrucomicrobiota bacterium]
MPSQALLAAIVVALLAVPRKYAPAAFFAGILLVPMGEGINVGVNLQPLRIVIIFGLLRALMRGEFPAAFPLKADKLMLGMVPILVFASFFYPSVSGALIYRLGSSLDMIGTYYLFRCWCWTIEELEFLAASLLLLFIPIAVMMTFERASGRDFWALLGGVPLSDAVRQGKFRARGPFANPITGGTIAAVCVPYAVLLWRQRPRLAKFGLFAIALIVFDCASSGPILTVAAGLGALYFWKYRRHLGLVIKCSLLAIAGLACIMKAPVWYLLDRIDIVGGSDGYHRARLISAAVDHFSQWWLAGTDYTRDWMPTGVRWSQANTDITNHYIHMGITGGFALLLLFLAILFFCYRKVGETMKTFPENALAMRFKFWVLGSALFAHMISMLGVSYFDQDLTALLYSLIAAIVSLNSAAVSGQLLPATRPADSSAHFGGAEPAMENA